MAATATSAGGANGGPAIYTGLGGSSSTGSNKNDDKSGSSAALDMGRSYGLTVVLAGLFTGVAIML